MRIRKDGDFLQALCFLAGQRVKLPHLLNLIPEQADPPGPVFQVSGKQFHIITAHTKRPAPEIQIISPVLQLGKGAQQGLPVMLFADRQTQRHGGIGFN